MNKFIGIGRISNDLELRQTNSGKSVVNFNLAVNRFGEGVDFIPVQLWGAQAENLVQYQSKGSQIAVEGSIRIDSYTDSEGNIKHSTYILAQNVRFLDKKTNNQTTNEVEKDEFEKFGEEIEIDDNFLD